MGMRALGHRRPQRDDAPQDRRGRRRRLLHARRGEACAPSTPSYGAPDGTLEGHNTDGDGFVASLRAAGADLAGRRVRAARRRRRRAGAGAGAGRGRRRRGRGGEPVRARPPRSPPGWPLRWAGWGPRPMSAAADLVVNATPVGMGDGPGALPVDPALLHAGQVVADIVMHPLDTALLQAARAAGATTVDGLGMLVHQAALAFTLWTGVDAPVAAMREAGRARAGRPLSAARAVVAMAPSAAGRPWSLDPLLRRLAAGLPEHRWLGPPARSAGRARRGDRRRGRRPRRPGRPGRAGAARRRPGARRCPGVRHRPAPASPA